MRLSPTRRLRRSALVLVAACSLTGAAAATPASAATRCPTGTSARTATLCLINAERAARSVRAVRLDTRLNRAARRHSADMVATRYFAHDSRSGSGFSARIARTGWMSGRAHWSLGENLGWGSGRRSTPRAIVYGWMHSTGHRANLLNPRFHVIGIGIASGTPIGGPGATYTTDFGS